MDVYNHIKLQESEILQFAEDSTDWAFTHGIVMRNGEHSDLADFVPFMLFPTPFPKYLYDEAMIVQKDFQTLYHRASLDHEFLQESLKSVIIHDDFTKRLYDIYDEVHKEDRKPKFYFTITRSDYMIDHQTSSAKAADQSAPYQIRQIEMNMIAASFSGLGTGVGKLHRFMADVMSEKCPYEKEKLPDCDTIAQLGEGMATAWQRYNVEDSVVVFVVMEGERNRFDQRLLEYSFHDNVKKLGCGRHVPILFRSLQQVFKSGGLSGDNRFLLEGREVALFYFRSGYSPDSYDEECWKARLLVEKSIAVKCPTVAEQLVGTKKVQQVFAAPGMVEKFVDDAESVKRIRKTFAGLFTLDPGSDGDAAVQEALAAPSNFVLKPQREGGGNNMYDDEMVERLKKTTDPVERSQYILMERVVPPIVKNYIVHPSSEKPILADTVTELGVFGVYISDSGKEIFNNSCGYILRSKSVEHKDGGVAAGRAVLDTPYLI